MKVEGPKGAARPEKAAAELLAYMYDRSLDAFAPHSPAEPALALSRTARRRLEPARTLGEAPFQCVRERRFRRLPTSAPASAATRLKFHGGYGIGGPGRRGGMVGGVCDGGASRRSPLRPPSAAVAATRREAGAGARNGSRAARRRRKRREGRVAARPRRRAAAAVALRSDFAETAFWQPHLLTGADGSASIEFTVPDSVTSWNVFVHAVTRTCAAGSVRRRRRASRS